MCGWKATPKLAARYVEHAIRLRPRQAQAGLAGFGDSGEVLVLDCRRQIARTSHL